MKDEQLIFAIEEKVLCDDAQNSILLKYNEVYTIIGIEEDLVILKGMYVTNQITKEIFYLRFKSKRFKKLPHMTNPIIEKPIWFEVYKSDEEEGTETIESFDTEEEAIDFIGDDETLDYDKWTIGEDGTNKRIE